MEEGPADASTIIYIAKAGAFEEVALCVPRLLIPPAVWREAVDDGERIGAFEVPRIRAARTAGTLRTVELSASEHRLAATIATQHRLGRGESEVLAVGKRTGGCIVDEGRASRVARALGLAPVSTLLLPVVGVSSGKLNPREALALLGRLAAVTGARVDVVQRIEHELKGN
jgi:predicted nucleic acid-binding protein